MDRWIPVSERKPEEEGSYLVVYRDEDGLLFSDSGWYFPSSDEFDSDSEDFPTVIYWMELPDPPKDVPVEEE